MRKATKLLLAGLLAVGTTTSAFAQNPMNDTLSLGLIPGFGIGYPDPHKPHHAPANISLPTVVYGAGTLLYIGTGNASFTYSVVDESDEVCLSGDITLSSGQEAAVSVASLPAGDYYLIIAIAGREYEGEFTIK